MTRPLYTGPPTAQANNWLLRLSSVFKRARRTAEKVAERTEGKIKIYYNLRKRDITSKVRRK